MAGNPAREAMEHNARHVEGILGVMDSLVLGKPEQTRLALAAVLAGGHVLIEDIPGVGKTTLAQALASALGLETNRVQCTSDLLPADITGISVFRRSEDRFEFVPGPVFCQVLLADELNRATPKTQSALLEAMQENQVTVDGVTRPLPQPFTVIATQNPLEQSGTYPLPESQLDRFLFRLEMGYPDPDAERAIIAGRRDQTAANESGFTPNVTELLALRAQTSAIRISEPMLDYVQAVVQHTRQSSMFRDGLSTRGAMALASASRAMALIDGREAVYPDDIQRVIPAIVGHRLHLADGQGRMTAGEIGHEIVDSVAIP